MSSVVAARAASWNSTSPSGRGPRWSATIVVLLVGDLLIVHRRPHAVTFREAAIESAVWITLGLAFTFVLGWVAGGAAAGEYLSGYLIEKSLSIDNVFVWAVIFAYFGVPRRYQFRVLFWGIFGALVLRAVFIFAGVDAARALRLGPLRLRCVPARHRGEDRAATGDGRCTPGTTRCCGSSAASSRRPTSTTARSCSPAAPARWLATPLFAVLVLVETTDVVFAVDSIPAILAVSQEPFIVFASNAFAILGLRALYFCLAGMADRFRYLNRGSRGGPGVRRREDAARRRRAPADGSASV